MEFMVPSFRQLLGCVISCVTIALYIERHLKFLGMQFRRLSSTPQPLGTAMQMCCRVHADRNLHPRLLGFSGSVAIEKWSLHGLLRLIFVRA